MSRCIFFENGANSCVSLLEDWIERLLRVGVVDTYDTAIIKLEKWNIVSPLGFRNQEDHQHMPRSTSNAHPGDSVTLILSVSWIRFIRL